MITRYEHLVALIAKHKPKTIIEIGVHRAYRAVYMIREALKHQESVSYVGYDVFETMGVEFQELVLNGKGMATENQARTALQQEQSVHGAHRMKFELIVGKTQDTLHGTNATADFVFIDGDHRLEAIAADYEAVAACKVVLFDDYYAPDPAGVTPDLTKYGANGVVEAIVRANEGDRLKVEILPHGDQCRHGGLSHIVAVEK